MIKGYLIKGFMLGLCMSALTTGAAFAQAVEGSGSTPAYAGAETEESKKLNAMQAEVDQILFADHLKEIEDKGILVNYTSVVDGKVEIGITPYSDENVKFLQELIGKEDITIVEFDQSVIYQTTVADPVAPDAAVEDQPTKEELYADKEGTATDDGKVYKGDDDKMEIQIESTDGATEEAIDNTSADLGGEKAQPVTTSANIDEVKGGEEGSKNISAPLMVLIIAGGAVLVGGVFLVSNKKKTVK